MPSCHFTLASSYTTTLLYTCTFSNSLSLSLSLTHTHTHTHTLQTHTHTLFYTCVHLHIPSLSQTHTHTSNTHTHSLLHMCTLTHSLSLTNAHTLCHNLCSNTFCVSYTHSNTYRQSDATDTNMAIRRSVRPSKKGKRRILR